MATWSKINQFTDSGAIVEMQAPVIPDFPLPFDVIAIFTLR